jgi:hypothetical protein
MLWKRSTDSQHQCKGKTRRCQSKFLFPVMPLLSNTSPQCGVLDVFLVRTGQLQWAFSGFCLTSNIKLSHNTKGPSPLCHPISLFYHRLRWIYCIFTNRSSNNISSTPAIGKYSSQLNPLAHWMEHCLLPFFQVTLLMEAYR